MVCVHWAGREQVMGVVNGPEQVMGVVNGLELVPGVVNGPERVMGVVNGRELARRDCCLFFLSVRRAYGYSQC